MADTCTQTSVPLEYQNQDSFFGSDAPLDQWVGYMVVLGFGAIFAVLTSGLMWFDQRYSAKKTVMSSEEFNCAGRTIKTGLTAANVVSMWTWAATLLQSSNVAYKFGVSGPFWYASGATIQVLLFGILAVEIKRKAPTAHTFCEMVKARWGKAAHITYLYFGLLTNVIVTSMLLLGGASVTNALTGIDVNLASFLIPWGVILYTVTGGLKAAFLAAYSHTAFMMGILCAFVFAIYAGDKQYVGSPARMYDLLDKVTHITDCRYGPSCEFTLNACGPVQDNHGGSYLTMLSLNGFIFGVINVIGNFGTVFLDQCFWQAAIAAKPSASHKGYLLGGLCWFSIPFALATSLGLAAVAMQLPLTGAEAGDGLVPPATALFIMGKAGATVILIILFLAVSAAGTSELIAVSGLITYDVYKEYIKPNATGKEILRVSQICVGSFGLFSGLFAVVLNQIGIGLGWVYVAMGCFIGSGVIPVALLMSWKKANASGAIVGAFGGQVFGILAWIIVAKTYYGSVTVDNLGADYSALSGNLVAILSSGLIHIVMSLAKPQNYNFESMRHIALVDKADDWLHNGDYDEAKLDHAQKWIVKWGSVMTLIIVILWPVLSMPAGIFTPGYFNLWVGISMVWSVLASVYIIFMPIIESWPDIMRVTYGVMGWGEYKSSSTRIAELENRVMCLETGVPVKPAAIA